jgi:HEAT repeat protein
MALVILGQQGRAAMPALMEAIHDPDSEVRAKAIKALCSVDPDPAVRFVVGKSVAGKQIQ